jgi:multidrug efflux pump
MSDFFISRPKFAWVVAIFISMAGLFALPYLPVAQFPVVAPPQIIVTATYPGASAEVMVESVTSVIEEELNGIKDMLYFESSSGSSGSADITVTFKPGTSVSIAQMEVQNSLKKAESRLPAAVIQQGLQVEESSAGFLMFYALSYKEDDSSKSVVALSEYASRSINKEIRRVEGVGKLQFFASEAAMRVWLDTQKMVSYGLSVEDVSSAIRTQNINVPAGSFGTSPGNAAQELSATIVVDGTLKTVEEFGQILLRTTATGAAVYLKDLARIEIGMQDYNFNTRLNGKKAALAAVQLAPGANAIHTVNAVKTRLDELSRYLPADMEITVPYDTSRFVKAAIEKVVFTLLEAIALVFLVMLLFLQNLRYTLIPTLVVPVCLMGTFAVMYLLGFSVNMMTMFGMVLAIGILVDDAIVVVENVDRLMVEEGLTPKQATQKAMKQVSGAIVGITLVLVAVFLPLAFMSGSVGVIYQQFSMALAVSILLSGILALTLTPALCASLLNAVNGAEHLTKTGFFGGFNRLFARMTSGYGSVNQHLIKRAGRCMLIYSLLLGVLAYAYRELPASFVPEEDQGSLMVDVQLPAGATYGRTEKAVAEIEDYLSSRDSMKWVTSVMGFSFSGTGENAAILFPDLKDWSERTEEQSVADETALLNERFADFKDGAVMAMVPPAIEGLGSSGGFSLRLLDRSGVGRAQMQLALDELLTKANQSPAIAYAMMEGLQDAPTLQLDIDRAKADALGVSFQAISDAVSTAFGSATINDFNNAGRQQRVVVQAQSEQRMTPQSLLQLHISSRYGTQVPLSSFASIQWQNTPVQLSRYNGYPSFSISGDAKAGASSGDVMTEMEHIVAALPQGIGYEWTGLSYQEKLSGSQVSLLITLSILVVFLVLVALYESWSIPLSVILIVPVGALGSVLTVAVLGLANTVYFKVGLITIIGLSAKNAILIIEFAKELHHQGLTYAQAVLQAARMRFRPIVMTSVAFILGVLPLTIATGPGAASQQALGTSVMGGMISATLLGVILVPVFYVWVMSFRKKDR